ncbi:MAG: hypothetical protein ACLFPI_04420 [Desulfobacterales bacterium]
MIARISSYFPGTESALWTKIISPKSLQYVALPVLSFVPTESGAFDEEWIEGKPYDLKLYLFSVIPLGRHRIKLAKIDKENNTIVSEETGLLARVWNHTISFHQSGDKEISYIDVVEIRAGLLTPIIWAFAHLFYRHRQRRWKKILKQA